MMMKNPPHPGLTEKLDCLESLGLTVTEGARILGVSRQALNSLLNCKNEISPEMSLRLSTAFGSSPETWLRMQIDFDPVSQKKVWGNGHAVALEI
ncbi:MAG: HigA family addiction module antidote protein [Proteobacteria bacterium]|nr:HigA family addiction module antidote protein [Pseudomonadota bacterium]